MGENRITVERFDSRSPESNVVVTYHRRGFKWLSKRHGFSRRPHDRTFPRTTAQPGSTRVPATHAGRVYPASDGRPLRRQSNFNATRV